MATSCGIKSVQLIPVDVDNAIRNRRWGRSEGRISHGGGPEGRAGWMATSCGTEGVQIRARATAEAIDIAVDDTIGYHHRPTSQIITSSGRSPEGRAGGMATSCGTESIQTCNPLRAGDLAVDMGVDDTIGYHNRPISS